MKRIKKISIGIVLAVIVLIGFVIVKNKTASKNISSNELDIHSDTDSELETYIDEAFKLLQINGKKSEEVWPDYDLSQNAIIICQRDDKTNKVIRAWKLTTSEKSILTNKELSNIEIPVAGSYNGVELEGTKSIIIAVSKNTLEMLKSVAIKNFIYEIGVHEMVHFHYESMFKLVKLAMEQKIHGGRGTVFPKVAEPRVYRKMLYDNLVMAFENPKEESVYLGKAKYWNEKWKTEYKGEYYQAKITDIMEGKARYIQYMLCIPENLSEQEKITWIGSLFDKSMIPSKSIDSESYKLGFIAGVLLDRKDSDWKIQLTKKPQAPVEYLLKNVEMIEDNTGDYEEKLKSSKKQLSAINKEIEVKLENIKKAENDIEIPFLQMSEKYLVGSFETSDFLRYMDKKITVDFGGTFENKNGTIVLNHISVYEKSGLRKSTYCLPLTMNYELSDGHLIIHSDEVSGDIRVKQTKDRNGRIIYTMK